MLCRRRTGHFEAKTTANATAEFGNQAHFQPEPNFGEGQAKNVDLLTYSPVLYFALLSGVHDGD